MAAAPAQTPRAELYQYADLAEAADVVFPRGALFSRDRAAERPAMLRLALNSTCVGVCLNYQPMHPDETIASWAKRHSGFVQLTPDSNDEDSFGEMVIDLPGLPRALKNELRAAARAPDSWLLRKRERTLRCARCVAEDWARGVPEYERRAWCVAWRTCCPLHGILFDTDKHPLPTWQGLLDGRWPHQELAVFNTRPFRVLLKFNLGNDRRGIHLESALSGLDRRAWFPKGMTAAALRATYREIVHDLLDQFMLPANGPHERQPSPGFNAAHNNNRFAINALAEAILSIWTNTPLPKPNLAKRTDLMMRAIGWGDDRPLRMRGGQVLVRGPTYRTCRLSAYAKLLSSDAFARLRNPEKKDFAGYLTIPEARLLGIRPSEELTWLATRAREGQFFAFHAQDGRLVENPYLPRQARLPPEAVPENMILPVWATRPATPRPPIPMEKLELFRPVTPDEELVRAALRRRSLRAERRGRLSWVSAGRGLG